MKTLILLFNFSIFLEYCAIKHFIFLLTFPDHLAVEPLFSNTVQYHFYCNERSELPYRQVQVAHQPIRCTNTILRTVWMLFGISAYLHLRIQLCDGILPKNVYFNFFIFSKFFFLSYISGPLTRIFKACRICTILNSLHLM